MLSRNLGARGVRWLVVCLVAAGTFALCSIAVAGPGVAMGRAAGAGSVTTAITAGPDAEVSLAEGSSKDILVTASNGHGAHPGTLTGIASGPSHGTATPRYADNSVHYVPTALYSGQDQFTCSMLDEDSEPFTLLVWVSVTEVNQAPIAVDDTVTVPFTFTSLRVYPLGNDSPGGADESGQTLSVVGVVPGSAIHNAAEWIPFDRFITYRCSFGPGFRGIDAFQYMVQDNGTTNGASDPQTAVGTVHIIVGDETAPVITAHDDVTAEADSPGGKTVTFSASANDNMEGTLTALGTPASGSFFPLGQTTVSLTATDTSGNHSSTTFKVNVVDTTPPRVINVWADPPTAHPGTPVVISAKAVDLATDIHSAEYRIDGGPWLPMNVDDGVFDDLNEAVSATIPGLALGTHAIYVRATDSAATPNTSAGTEFAQVVVSANDINADKTRVLAELRALAPKVNRRDRSRLDHAIAHLGSSLTSSRWIDGSHPRPGRAGVGVFEQEAAAVELLHDLGEHNRSGLSARRMSGYVNRLIRVDRALAVQATGEARVRHGNSGRVKRALASLTLGDKDFRQAHSVRAIRHYGDAWRVANGG